MDFNNNSHDEFSTNDLYDIMLPDTPYSTAEEQLREAGLGAEADIVLQLIQDAGLELDPTFDPDNPLSTKFPETSQGEATIKLRSNYERVTHERCHRVLLMAKNALNAINVEIPSP